MAFAVDEKRLASYWGCKDEQRYSELCDSHGGEPEDDDALRGLLWGECTDEPDQHRFGYH